MARRSQKGPRSGIGSLVRKRDRRGNYSWYIVGYEETINLDGTRKIRRPSVALPADITTKQEAEAEFNRRAQEAMLGKTRHAPTTQTVKALVDAYIERNPDAQELAVAAARQWANVHGAMALPRYGAPELLAFRDKMDAEGGNTRETVNRKLAYIKNIAKWGVTQRLCPAEILPSLDSVPNLVRGKSISPDGKGREPCSIEEFNAALDMLKGPMHDALYIIRCTGARPTEILDLMPEEINTTVDPWMVTKIEHKTEHKGKSRFFGLPQEAVEAILPYMPGQPGTPLLTVKGKVITERKLRDAVTRACKKAGIERFVPYDLRHLRNTEVRAEGGIKMAQANAGHSSEKMTENYTREAAKAEALALAKAAALVGVPGND